MIVKAKNKKQQLFTKLIEFCLYISPHVLSLTKLILSSLNHVQYLEFLLTLCKKKKRKHINILIYLILFCSHAPLKPQFTTLSPMCSPYPTLLNLTHISPLAPKHSNIL